MNDTSPNKCSACSTELTYKSIKFFYWCPECYALYKKEIIGMVKWTRVLENSEQLRRQRRKKPSRTVSLDEMEEKRIRRENAERNY